MTEKTKRGPRTHSGQFEIYLSRINSNYQMKSGTGDPVELKKSWEELTNDLNAYGGGPVKNSTEWQITFRSWKNQVRHKERIIKVSGNATGGGLGTTKRLTDLEERALSAWGREPNDGNQMGVVGLGTCHATVPTATFNDVEFLDDECDDMMNSAVFTTALASSGSTTTAISTPAKTAISASNTQTPIQPSVRPRKSARASKNTAALEMFKEANNKIADAISRLADRIGDLAVNMERNNEMFKEIIVNHNSTMLLLMQNLNVDRVD